MAETTADEAEVEGGEAVEAPKRKRFSGKKLVLFVALPVLLLGGGGGAVWYLNLAAPVLDKIGMGPESAKPKPVIFYDLPEMLVNLNSTAKQASYLKLRASLELDDPQASKKLDDLLPRVLDNFQVYLRELRMEDLNGSSGMYRLKEELLMRVNAAVQPIHVNDVLFKEMLVQ
ncbi:MAG TPA: flagellar basal body-associated FliL family protein [Candidatus Cybelea sp.]|nr:flagellar basal body-associated FliL family protein [Candidatus Cybelea sp.]